MEQGSTTKGTGAKLDIACRSKAQRPLEQSLTGMTGAGLGDRLVGARLDNEENWSKTRPCLPEQDSTARGARLDWDDRSSALRSLGWSKARQPRALKQGSTVPAGARLDGPWSKARQGSLEKSCSTIAWLEPSSTTKGTIARLDGNSLEQRSTGMTGVVLDDYLIESRLDHQGHWS